MYWQNMSVNVDIFGFVLIWPWYIWYAHSFCEIL